MDFSLNVEANAATIRDYLNAVINPLELHRVDSKKALELYRSRRDDRRFTDEFVVCIDEDHVILIGQSPRRISEIQPEAFFFFWNNNLYPLYTLTVWWRSAGQQNPVSLIAYSKIDSTETDALFKKPTTIILLRERQCISALDINIASVAPEKWQKCFLWPPYEFVGDETAAKVWVHYNIRKHDPNTSPEEGFEYSWARRLHVKAREAIEFFRDPKNPAALLYAEFEDIFWRRHHDVWSTAKFISADLKDAPIHCDFILAILQCAWFSSLGTDCGKQLWSIESDGSTKEVRFEAKEFGSRAHLFWERMPFEYPYFYEQFFGGSSFPIDIEQFVSTAPIYEGDIKRGREFINDLLAEAISSKQWTIPFGAYVQIQFGQIKAVKLFEIGSDIACVFVNNEGEFFSVWINPRSDDLQLTQSSEIANAAGRLVRQKRLAKHIKADDPEWRFYSEEYLPRFRLGIHLLLAAIIRDFWVVENRERVFGRSFPNTKIPRLNGDRRKQRIVYLPRVRYVGDLEKRGEELNLAARKAHFVVGHLRKALHATEEQIQLARRYGIVVPEGFTFVRPHRRGDEAQERIYRSRSALQCIQALESTSEAGQPDTWFHYELNVKNWLANNGFEIQRLAANRRGDGGVDIQAQKENENLLVQCKYWLREKIGPSVIREMLGTLQTFPAGSRGVIVTCSELTEGARRLAIENGIRLSREPISMV
jgi:hypothetical protein